MSAATTALVADRHRDEPDEPPALPQRPVRALDDTPDPAKRLPPADPELLERVLGGLRSLQFTPVAYRWRIGFLSDLLHAVAEDCDEWEFRGQAIQWSVCGAPALKAAALFGRARCPRCVVLSGDSDLPPDEPSG